MVERGGKDARAERLAAALRDNLRRRKARARAQPADGGDAPPAAIRPLPDPSSDLPDPDKPIAREPE